ncbi:MAG: tagaturonate reductase [Candidatus Helarchaeota archaeon]|nr:tagaturonate reductase [Candidatus Helarchaeota archaeon]
MPLLTKKFLSDYSPAINITIPHKKFFNLPVKIIQFGEGRFIRAFLNYFIEVANQKKLFNGRSIVIQPRKADKASIINAQDGLFTLCSRGLKDGVQKEEFMIISSIKKAIAAKTQWPDTIKLAEIPSVEIISSNTTEAGLVYDLQDSIDKTPPDSFPGKLTALLHHRYQYFDGDPDKGFMILPLELIENNGNVLKNLVIKLAKYWNLEEKFIRWLEMANFFYKSIVDRIVTGYPKKEEIDQFNQKLGYEDKLFNIAELYHSWIIEGDKKLQTTIPFDRAGLNVQFVSNIKNYFLRKVRILNGAHTSMVPIAYLSGKNLVKESIEDSLINIYIQNILEYEVIPFVDLPQTGLKAYKNTIIERFRNPFLQHKLLSISLYSSSKMRLRILPSIIGYYEKFKTPPPLLPFAFAAFLVFMRIREKSDAGWFGLRASEKYEYNDNSESLKIFYKAWKSIDPTKTSDITNLVSSICKNTSLWERDLTQLPDFVSIVANYINQILKNGLQSALKQLLGKYDLIG